MNSYIESILLLLKNILFEYWNYIILGILVTILILFILWVIISYYTFKWFKLKVDAEYLYYDKYNDSCKNILDEFGDYSIKRVYIVRKPVLFFMKILINIITFYKFNVELEKIRKDIKDENFLPQHPFIVIEVELPDKSRKQIKVEKINRIRITTDFDVYHKQTMHKIPVKKKYTLKKLLTKTRKRIGDKRFFNWGIYKNNSQEFVKELLITFKSLCKKNENFVCQSEMTEMPTKFTDFNMYTINCVRNISNMMESILIRVCNM